ncbi:MAG: hypothetical protein ACK56I_33455, partial [bacterium]
MIAGPRPQESPGGQPQGGRQAQVEESAGAVFGNKEGERPIGPQTKRVELTPRQDMDQAEHPDQGPQHGQG